MSHQADAILLSTPPIARKKVAPKPSNKFLCNASEEERVACVRLIRIMRTNTTYTEGYWLSFFLQGLLKLDAATSDDEISIESAEKFIGDMKNLQSWNNWLRGASNREHFKDHPAFAWIREQEEVQKQESVQAREVRQINDMFLAPDKRVASTEDVPKRERR